MGCAFQCAYCFARHRGGNSGGETVRPADPEDIINRLEYAERVEPGPENGMITQCLTHRMPIHLGGMSDPFQPVERRYRVTKKVISKMSEINYPVVISTKSPLVSEEIYINELKENENVVVQFSLSTIDDEKAKVIEKEDVCPSKILNSAEKLSESGIPVTLRWQPYIPGISESPDEFTSLVSSAGVKHIAVEHLKIPLEKKKMWSKIRRVSGGKMEKLYRKKGSIVERELVLDSEAKIETVLSAKKEINKKGISFGAADNDMQYLSDTKCCCSGIDQFEGFEKWFKYQISNAVKMGIGKEIKFSNISNKWRPKGSIDRYLNSNSRISKKEGNRGTISEHIEKRWENKGSEFNPTSYWGVEYSGRRDEDGRKIYKWDDEKIDTIKQAV